MAEVASARLGRLRKGSGVKGIILAGGTGTRLWPITQVISKQLLPVHDKPMIYYPLTTLMLAGIREILVITTPRDAPQFRELLGDGSAWGLELHYAVQHNPTGSAEAFLVDRHFIARGRSALVLGDNIFHGQGFATLLQRAASSEAGAFIFCCWVREPSRYGVIDFAPDGGIQAIVEKPAVPPSNYAVTGLYFYDEYVTDIAASLKPSARGELEITDLNNCYLRQRRLQPETLGREFAWFDIGTPDSLSRAAEHVAKVEVRQGLKIGCPEEVAWRQGWIDDAQLEALGGRFKGNSYGRYLVELLKPANSVLIERARERGD